MSLSSSSASLLKALPELSLGGVTLYVVDAGGRIDHLAGPEDGTSFTYTDGALRVHPGPGRAFHEQPLHDGEVRLLATFDAAARAVVTPFLDVLLDLLLEKEQLERDLESMHPSTLGLLEEVSMWNDTMPGLGSGQNEAEIAEEGLKALVVAASVERALFVRVDDRTRQAEVLVQVRMDGTSGRPVAIPYEGESVFPQDQGLVGRALHDPRDAILEKVPPGGSTAPDLPEALARQEVIAVPVRYGVGARTVSLGVLMVMDKRANLYTDQTQELRLGSQESKLATAVASMLGAVLGTRKEAEVRKEISTATAIQQQILPERPAHVPGFDLAGQSMSSGAVGGDYFDFVPLADGRTLAVVADVSGHNLASGMIMVSMRATLRAVAARQQDLGRVFDDVGRCLYKDLSRTERFITAAGVALAPHRHGVEVVNAGHCEAMLYRARTRTVQRVPSQSSVLGFLPVFDHHVRRLSMQPGDVLLLYTDGITEAEDTAAEMFGEPRLAQVLARAANWTAAEVLQAVFEAVDDFAEQAPNDDVTAVVVKALPLAPAAATKGRRARARRPAAGKTTAKRAPATARGGRRTRKKSPVRRTKRRTVRAGGSSKNRRNGSSSR